MSTNVEFLFSVAEKPKVRIQMEKMRALDATFRRTPTDLKQEKFEKKNDKQSDEMPQRLFKKVPSDMWLVKKKYAVPIWFDDDKIFSETAPAQEGPHFNRPVWPNRDGVSAYWLLYGKKATTYSIGITTAREAAATDMMTKLENGPGVGSVDFRSNWVMSIAWRYSGKEEAYADDVSTDRVRAVKNCICCIC